MTQNLNLRFMAATIAAGAIAHPSEPDEIAKKSIGVALAIDRECEQYDAPAEERDAAIKRALNAAYETGFKRGASQLPVESPTEMRAAEGTPDAGEAGAAD